MRNVAAEKKRRPKTREIAIQLRTRDAGLSVWPCASRLRPTITMTPAARTPTRMMRNSAKPCRLVKEFVEEVAATKANSDDISLPPRSGVPDILAFDRRTSNVVIRRIRHRSKTSVKSLGRNGRNLPPGQGLTQAVVNHSGRNAEVREGLPNDPSGSEAYARFRPASPRSSSRARAQIGSLYPSCRNNENPTLRVPVRNGPAVTLSGASESRPIPCDRRGSQCAGAHVDMRGDSHVGNRCWLSSALFLILPVGFLTSPLWSGVGPASAADALTFDAPVQTSDFGEPSSFSGVSCSDGANCVAVGGEQRDTETNGTWGSPVNLQEDTSADVPAQGITASAVGVSCFNSINCTVVGADSNRQPITETEYNGLWEPAFEDPILNPDVAGFDSVSCPGLRSCTAIGYDNALGGGGSLSDTTSDGVWNSTSSLPNSTTGQSFSISCVDPTDCTAVGFLGSFSPPQVFGYDIETNGVWAPAGEPPNDEFGEFHGVSCTSPQDCTAVGSTGADASPTDDPVYDTETNGVWGPITVVNGSLGGSGSFASVSCVDASDCVAVGSDGNGQPIYAVDTGGVWGPVNEDTGATGGGGEFSSVSCTSLGVCTAVGGDREGIPSMP